MNRIKFFFATLIAGIAFAVGGPAMSQVCGEAYMQIGGGDAGTINCIPIEQYYPPADVQLEDPGPEWATRWGAIAYDGVAGKFGGAENLTSLGRAKKASRALFDHSDPP
jgi:hypothetical protein